MQNVFLIITLFLFWGCKKEGDETFGWAKARFNNIEWKADEVRCVRVNRCWNGYISVEFKKMNRQGYLRESIFLTFYPVQGLQTLKKGIPRPPCNDSLRISTTPRIPTTAT